MTNARTFLEQSLGRPLKSGSLGRVVVDRAEQGRGWMLQLAPSYDGRPSWVKLPNKDAVRAAIAAWAAHRQQLLGLDVGTYSAELPVDFGPVKKQD